MITFGKVKAIVSDPDEFIIDIIIGADFEEAYDIVREAYPQARWDSGCESIDDETV